MTAENSLINLLLIEKDDETRSGIERFFKMSGYRVTCATDEREAIRVAGEESKPDLILFNTYLSPPKSFALAYDLHRQPPVKNIPMVIISVHDHTSDQLDDPDIDAFTVGYITEVARLDELESLVKCLQDFPK